jgi:hypothetical protein
MSVASAFMISAIWVAAVHAGSMASSLPHSLGTWLTAQYFAAAQLIAIGLIATFLTNVVERLHGPFRKLTLVGLFLVGCGILRLALEDDANGPAERLAPWLSVEAVYWMFGIVASALLACAFFLGRALPGPGSRGLVILAASAVTVGNARLLPLSYPGIHLTVAIGAALIIAGALTGSAFPSNAARLLPAFAPKCRAILGLALGLCTLPAFLVPPPNAVLLALLHQPAAVLMPAVAQLWTAEKADFHVPADQMQWFMDRSRLPAVPPTRPGLPDAPELVILLGIDSLRADLLADESFRERLPELFQLRDESVWFDNARSPGSSTAPSLAALFSGVHYSQLYWSLHTRRRPETFPHQDDTPRFPALLAQAGISTSTVDTSGWLLNTFGIVSGFTEETSARNPKKRSYPSSKDCFKDLRAQIERGMKKKGSRHFQFIHYLDAHAPYTSAGHFKSKFDGYIAELGLVDRELGRLRRHLKKRGLSRRASIIVFSDHGEAFGEHGLTWHGSTLYDVMIRVPLLFHGTGLRPRRVHTPVSVIDIGPTILDLYSLPTPSHLMGQSLVGLMQGHDSALTRPLISEARLKRSLVQGDLKVIHDTRSGTVELYDLKSDPDELQNLYSSDDPRSQRLLGTLSAFFEQHTHRRPGYTVPYRKW